MEPSSPERSPAKLERIGRYRIVRPLSKGGMALVYEGRRESLAGVSPRVAIKVILPEFVDSDTFQQLFVNEARLGASMHHQNLVQIQDFDRDGDRFFLVMEYVEGVTLRKAISLCKQHAVRIPMGVIAEIGRQACDGLHYAHAAMDEHGNHLHLVHRDVKPSNLILNPQGVVKLLDFGISKGRLMREKKGAVKGTWGYMAPEQAFGKEVNGAADVFGLATCLYELASGRVLFEGKDKTRIKRLLMDDHAARMAATLEPSYYGGLTPVLVRALQRDPQARFENAADFSRHLSALLPDPITSRDEVVSFYRMVSGLNDGLPVEEAARSADFRSEVAPSQGSILEAPSTAATIPVPVWLIGGFAVLSAALLLVLVLAFVLQTQLPGEADPGMQAVIGAAPTPLPTSEPGGPAAAAEEHAVLREVPERPPPSTPVELSQPTARPKPTDPPAPTKIVVVRRPSEQATEVSRSTPGAAVEGDPGFLTIGARQDAEIYVDGQYVRRVPMFHHEYPPGHHVITIQALDGRKQTFEIDLEPGQEIRRVWDFDRGEWRK